MLATLPKLETIAFPPLKRSRLGTLQVNLGYRCNQQCLHCHVNAGPNRTEQMDDTTFEQLLGSLESLPLDTLDLTGGAPELHPRFRELVSHARSRGIKVIDRCNLTILFEPGQEGLADFLAEQRVEVVASLPCYLQENVDAQRGKGVFDKSIQGLQRLNQVGYGRDPELMLNLVYNPQGPSLPPPQQGLEADYKKQLKEQYDIDFSGLYTITNMPIARFGSTLLSKGQFDSYMAELQANHRDENLATVMCRNLISIDWQGRLYDCDFNQMLNLPIEDQRGESASLAQLPELSIEGQPIRTAGHCFGCTAGAGSSCGGALS